VEALRNAGCDVKGMVAIFSYNLQKALDNFNRSKCPLFTLSDYDELIKQAIENNYISEKNLKSLMNWRKDPENWAADL
jgi:orotate phosphoribosyltransferase